MCRSGAGGRGLFAPGRYLVLIDSAKAKGRKEIVDACPYGVAYRNAESNLPQKCTLCAHMLDTGEKTRAAPKLARPARSCLAT
jgi:Fe-S-cluster-containing dehydrogenase component